MKKKPESIATAIGSFPHLNADEACQCILKYIPRFPVWPQLPKLSFYEEINNQYSKRLPCFYIDKANKRSGFDTSINMSEELNDFYSKILEDDVDYFAFDDRYSKGFFALLKALSQHDTNKLYAVKGQIVGPLTHGVVADAKDGKYAIYKPDLYDAIVKNGIMNARWQIRELKKFSSEVVIFIDEPSLSILGSGYYSVKPDQAYNLFDEVINAIIEEGGIPGMHCCGNADWNRILQLNLEIINFDASDEVVADKFINSEKLHEFLDKGNSVAWGIVPTIGEKIEKETYENIENNFTSMIRYLNKKGFGEDRLLSQSIITPSCGTGTLPVELCEKVMAFTRKLSHTLRGNIRS